MKPFFFIVFSILLLFMVLSTQYKEGFIDNYCSKHADCNSCAASSGCSWCPANNQCLGSTSLKSTDKSCNAMNTIQNVSMCNLNKQENIDNDVKLNNFALYKDQITDNVRPPNVYLTKMMEYSPETVMGNVEKLRKDLQMYQHTLPNTVAASVENNIRPMVRGILSENYYIQM